MSDRFDWYKREPKKFIRGVRGMGPELIGCYAVILDLIYEDEDSCPNDPHFIGGILGCSSRKTAAMIRRLLELDKIQLRDDGKLINFKAVSELENRAKQRRRLAEAGANGGRSTQARISDLRKNNELGSSQALEIENKKENKKENKIPPSSPPKAKHQTSLPLGDANGFEEFWRTYPRRTAKGSAEKAYATALKSTDPPTLLAAIKKFADGIGAGQDPRYIPHAATWLNSKRWLDETPKTGLEIASDFDARVRTVLAPEGERQIKNFRLTFGADHEAAWKQFRVIANSKDPLVAANDFFFEHGKPGCSIGTRSRML